MRRFLAIPALVLIFAAAAFAQDAGPGHSLRQDEPSTGSNVPRRTVDSRLPLDKRYDELTPEQQEGVKSWYESMGPLDEPPFPVDGLGPIYKAIQAAELKLDVLGPLTMFVNVDSQGKPTSVTVRKSPDSRMTQAAATILMLQDFKPAKCGGQPCTMQFPLRITFTRH
jgi:hypothetical protein